MQPRASRRAVQRTQIRRFSPASSTSSRDRSSHCGVNKEHVMPSVEMLHARTSVRDPGPAAEELCSQLGSIKPKLVTLFASRDRDHQALNRAVRERLPKETRLIGATTNGEVDRDG